MLENSMQMEALVTVVVPTYNHAHFLGRALQSLLDQTYSRWEALIIDNYSQDNTNEVVHSFGDPRIRLLKIHNHGVIAASRNMGIIAARGDWIAFLDSDDCWYVNKLEIIMAAVAADDAYDVLSTDELIVDVNTGSSRILRHGPYQEDFYKILLLEGNRLSPSSTVVRRTFLERHGLAFDESHDYITVEDYGLWLNLARSGARFKFINQVQGEYVIHDTNSSAQLERHLRNGEALLHEHVFNVQQFDPAPERLWRRVSTRLRLRRVKQFIVNRQWREAVVLALKTVIYAPNGTAILLFSKLKRLFTQ
jgi:glycosyltransferase involved in cell wall biosynthesis